MTTPGTLAGKTLFITGASRGIGLAIALRAARDGANVVIAAKTADPHPKLPGTIYTAAKEIENAGGKCLPCVVDIRNEDQVVSAVNQAVNKFGGLDILVNNASAISLTGTLDTPMKKYDLMNQVNVRGTYLCSRACLPYLKKGNNPHILNISPPLNMSPMWFKNHVAYTIAKYGMSMCALGMAEEFKSDGVAVNCLWPRTAIITAAMEMLGGGSGIASQCRRPEIMADAAHAVLTKPARSFTGHFAVDDDVLRNEGVTDLAQYAVDPAAELMPDFFLEGASPDIGRQVAAAASTDPGKKAVTGSGDGDPVSATFDTIKRILNKELVDGMKAVYAFEMKDSGDVWYLDLATGSGAAGRDKPAAEVSCTMTMTSENFVKMFAGKLKPTTAFMTGGLKIKGDMGKAMKLEKLMGKMKAKL